MKQLFTLITMIMLLGSTQAQTIYYVKPTGTGDGSSWDSPLANVQTAINTASAGDQVWVAAGSYYGLAADLYTFVLKDGVSLYGGFAGTETSTGQRDLSAHISTLTGGYFSAPYDNVVNGTNVSAATVVDGFTVAPYQSVGPKCRGMYFNNSFPVIRNCIVAGNVTFQSSSYDGYGAAVYDDNNSSPQFYNCTFSNNQAMNYGGAVYNNIGCSPVFYQCVFDHNKASVGGGGVYDAGPGSAYINCAFTNNACTALNGTWGGGISFSGTGSPAMINCLIANNTAGNYGAGIFSVGSTPDILNCTISNNTASANATGGAAIYYIPSGSGSVGSITNSIVWGNLTPPADAATAIPQIVVNGGSVNPVVSNSIITYGQYGSVSQDPLFIDVAAGNFQLQPVSPAINAGNNAALPAGDTIDLAGSTRIAGSTVDMGAYEFRSIATPVAVYNFAGTLHNGTALLQWQTGVESSFNHFEIDKSADGKSFSFLASVQATGSNGNYTYGAPQAEPTAYYRLKEIDNDGSETVYPYILALTQNNIDRIPVYPNPAADHISIKAANAGSISIYDAAGRLMKTVPVNAGMNVIDVRSLSNGIYFGRFSGNDTQFTFIKK